MRLSSRVSLFFFCSFALPLFAQARDIPSDTETETATQSLFDYLLTPHKDIGTDRAAQDKWLAPDLKSLVRATRARVQTARAAGKEEMGPDPHEPSNGDFLFSWDFPTTCKVTSSRQAGDDRLVYVYCGWGKHTNYPGMGGDYTVVLTRDAGQWLVRDIWYSNAEEKTRTTLTHELQETISQAKKFESRGHW